MGCQTSYSRVARPTSVGSLETVGTNFGPHTYYEADFAIELEIGYHPVNLFGLLQRTSEGESEVYDKMKEHT
jgi:hypothetical protein